jgi:hypothetical protein
MASKLFLIIMLILPAVVTFGCLSFLQDAVLTLLALLLLYLTMTFLYSSCIDSFQYEPQLTKEFLEKGQKIKNGVILGLLGSVGFGLLFSLYSMYAPIGIKLLTLPFPIRANKWRRFGYQCAFHILWVLNAAASHFYFNFFIAVEDNEKEGIWGVKGDHVSFLSGVLISLGNGLLCLAVFWWTMSGWFSVVLFTGLAVVFNYVLVRLRFNQGLIVSTSLKVGLAVGILIWFWYLYFGKNGMVVVRNPQSTVFGSKGNIWHQIFKEKAVDGAQ